MAVNHKCVGARRETLPDLQWLNEKKAILERIKAQVRLYLGDEPSDVRLYAQAYKRDIERPWQISSMELLKAQLLDAEVVFGGDFHPFSQAQRSHLRILRDLQKEKEIVLGMECFFAKHQKALDQFVSGELEEAKFLKKIKWDEEWGFPWSHYRPLVDFAKKHKIKVLALNLEQEARSGKSLHERDYFAADLIAESLEKNPDKVHYVLFGDLHIAENHLPKCLKKQFKTDAQIVNIYLNSESIYFALAEQGHEGDVEVVSFNENQYCILSSPPWVKWQSYLMYLEENFDFILDEDEDEDEDQFRIDHTDHVSSLVHMISAGLGLQFKTDDIEVYSLKDPQVLKVTKRMLPKKDYEIAHFLVQQDTSFYFPQKGFFYLSKATVNHAATMAAQYIHGKLSKRSRLLWNFPEDFLSLVWVEAMGFMLSKFVNPKRKAQTMNDLKKQLEAFDLTDRGREPLLLALDQKMSELLQVYQDDKRKQKYVPGKKSSYTHAARFLGEMLGERYFLLYKKSIITAAEMKILLSQEIDNKSFEDFYFEQLKILDKLELGVDL